MFGDPRRPQTIQEKSRNMFKKYYVHKSQNAGIRFLKVLEKAGAEHSDDPLNDFLKSGILDQYLPEAWNGMLRMRDIFSKKTCNGF